MFVLLKHITGFTLIWKMDKTNSTISDVRAKIHGLIALEACYIHNETPLLFL